MKNDRFDGLEPYRVVEWFDHAAVDATSSTIPTAAKRNDMLRGTFNYVFLLCYPGYTFVFVSDLFFNIVQIIKFNGKQTDQ
jgi:hypothetical protein